MDKYIQIDLPDDGTVQASEFADIQGQDISKTFQKKDESGNVAYSVSV